MPLDIFILMITLEWCQRIIISKLKLFIQYLLTVLITESSQTTMVLRVLGNLEKLCQY